MKTFDHAWQAVPHFAVADATRAIQIQSPENLVNSVVEILAGSIFCQHLHERVQVAVVKDGVAPDRVLLLKRLTRLGHCGQELIQQNSHHDVDEHNAGHEHVGAKEERWERGDRPVLIEKITGYAARPAVSRAYLLHTVRVS